MPQESTTTVKKHVTTACTFCRRRKIKCDGATPICSNCETNHRVCKYNNEDDKRKMSYRRNLDVLLARVKLLERTLEEHGTPIPPETSDESFVPFNEVEETVVPGNTTTNTSPAQLKVLESAMPMLARRNTNASDLSRSLDGRTQIQSQTSPSAQDSENSSTSEGDSITDDLATQMGSLKIAEDGKLRYFGPTSNLHIVHNGLFSLSRGAIRMVSEEGQAVMDRMGVGHRVDPEVERHLTSLYFVWEDPAIHVVDEEMFYAEKHNWSLGRTNTPYYSETLNNAICAVAANLSTDRSLGVPEPAAEFFSARAKALLEIEMDSPSVATVQALVIMSASEAAFTRDARGWLYSGMAVRLSADLGLHLDLTEQVQKGILTYRELEVRRTTFWGVFIHDNMWSLYVGRPWGIDIRDISISRPPREIDIIKNKRWWPYGFRIEGNNEQDEFNLLDPIEACADANITLCEMMREINRTLYAGHNIPAKDLLAFASDMRLQFSNWRHLLPESLKVDFESTDRIYLPHVLQLHLQFYVLSIFLHRPFFSRSLLRQSDLSPSAKVAEVQNARNHCTAAANDFVQVLKIFNRQYTLNKTNVQMVHLVFTASLIHVYNACITIISNMTPSHTVGDVRQAMDNLQMCCQALRDMGSAWQNSTRALEVIICIKQEWQSRAALYAASIKRPNSSVTEDNDTSLEHHRQRRRRTLTSSRDTAAVRMVPPISMTQMPKIPPQNMLLSRKLGTVGTNQVLEGGTSRSSNTDVSSDPQNWQFLDFPDQVTGIGNDEFNAARLENGESLSGLLGGDDLLLAMGNYVPGDDLFDFALSH